jgi:PAS domain S-box-containing protein
MSKKTILVVDDTPQILKLSKDVFELAGYNVITANDGLEAMERLGEGGCDLVVTDILMPNVDGYNLCYTIRISEVLKSLPVIIYSATYTSSSDEAMAMEIGADMFIRKPASMHDLLAAAERLLTEQRPHRNIPIKPKSLEATRLYNEGLVSKLERRNLELERAKERLELGEAQLKEAQAVAHIGSWEIDLQRQAHLWSDELYKIFGVIRHEEQPSQEVFLSIVYSEDRDYVSRQMGDAFMNLQASSFDFRFVRRDGEMRYGFSKYQFQIARDGTPLRIYGVVQDVTEKKIAEEALRAAHERLLFHMDNTPLGFIKWDNKMRVTAWSSQSEAIFGWTEHEVIDGQRSGYPMVYEEDLPWVNKIMDRLLSGEITRNKVLNRNYTKDKRVIWCEWFNSVLKDDAGRVVTIMSMVQDITERKNLENMQLEKLEKLVDERTRDLNEALNKEKELVEMRNKFVSIASHEFRTPLSSISLASGFIRKYAGRIQPHELDKKLESIEKQVQIMTHLLDDVLTVGKADAGKLQVTLAEFRFDLLEELVREVMKATGASHALRYSLSCNRPSMMTDEKFLRNIVTNLITNAVKFSPDAVEVIMNVACDNESVVISVKDFGIGIPPEYMKDLFTSFSRGSNVGTIEGTGLGLSIVKKAVDLLKGSIVVKSVVGRGTEIEVTLPLAHG